MTAEQTAILSRTREQNIIDIVQTYTADSDMVDPGRFEQFYGISDIIQTRRAQGRALSMSQTLVRD